MNTARPSRIFADERGMALAMSLMVLLVLSALVLAFLTLSSTEPTIGNNHARVAQARAIAEAGIERGIWALCPGNLLPCPEAGRLNYDPSVGGLGTPAFNGSMSANGNQQGVFQVDIGPDLTAPADPWRVSVNSVGWVPDGNPSNPHQRITATLMRLRNLAAGAGSARCALCVRGSLEVWGSSVVDSRGAEADPACGPPGLRSRPGTFTTGATSIGGSAEILGSDQPAGNIRNYEPRVSTNLDDVGGPYDIIKPGTPDDPAFEAAFDQFKFKDYELDALRAIAKANGTYFQGSVTFNASNKIPSGIVFVDTVNGQNITDATPIGNFANVDMHGNAGSDDGNTFNGWLIVNGSLHISGNVKLQGLVYATNDVSYQGTGTGGIHGQLISANVRDTVASQVYDTTTTGNSLIQVNCAFVRDGGAGGLGGGFVSQAWSLVAGSYKEPGD